MFNPAMKEFGRAAVVGVVTFALIESRDQPRGEISGMVLGILGKSLVHVVWNIFAHDPGHARDPIPPLH
jgi:uncharacterized membrane protein YeaQ/YmgE (transglycosylase-associated protein family)